MAHLEGKTLYKKLGKKLDNLTARTPWNETLYEILKALFTAEEAELFVKMPYRLSSLNRVSRITGYDIPDLQPILEGMCEKGLVVDVWTGHKYRYMPSPMVIGLFEFTMMRTRGQLNMKQWGELFDDYLLGSDDFMRANASHGENVSVMRALPHEEAFTEEDFVEVLDYEKATAIIEEKDKFAIGLCSCRHEKFHIDKKPCKTPLDTCSSFGRGAEYLIRHGMAREVSKSEMLDNIARSKELKLVLTADNVQKNVGFICHCCKCCCNLMLGVTQVGYPNILVTSNYISEIDLEKCTGCEKCAKKCPVNAIEMVPIENPKTKKPKDPMVDTTICLGCGVCALECHMDAVRLAPRPQRVIHPETTFERVILQCLERGTLQNQLFDDPQSITQASMRALVGGFLKLKPVKQALMSNQLRSRFLGMMTSGAKTQKTAWKIKI